MKPIGASRGSGAQNLSTVEPKEIWRDNAVGSEASITIDLGGVRSIDTIFLGFVTDPADAATFRASGGIGSYGEFAIQEAAPLRAPDAAGIRSASSHALWHGAPVNARYVSLGVTQTSGQPISAGIVIVGKAFRPALGQEWGAGRRPIDTGSVTPLLSGGFAIVEGARKRHLNFTLGDLSEEEADQLEALALDRGESRPVLIVENVDRTPGLRQRIHYGLFERWRAFERRNRKQTRWEIGLEEWV
ncbi:hypothetical protein ACX0GZ_04325 [Sphingomonas aestuarii]